MTDLAADGRLRGELRGILPGTDVAACEPKCNFSILRASGGVADGDVCRGSHGVRGIYPAAGGRACGGSRNVRGIEVTDNGRVWKTFSNIRVRGELLKDVHPQSKCILTDIQYGLREGSSGAPVFALWRCIVVHCARFAHIATLARADFASRRSVRLRMRAVRARVYHRV